MKSKRSIIALNVLAAALFVSSVEAIEVEECDLTENVKFITNDIFNLADKDTIFLHEWANFLHIMTKQVTLLNESAFFLQKCQVREADLQELERHLRSKKYIRDARVKFDDNEKIQVETWDNWSLLPTLDFGRKGGKNKFALGIKDRNLLGLGIDAEIEYFTNDQRSGYKLDTQFPLFLHNNTNASIRLTSNDDGSSEAIFLNKEFVSFDTPHAYFVGFDNFNQIDTQYEVGLESNRFQHEQRSASASWFWLLDNSFANTWRMGVGYTSESHQFSPVELSTDTQTLWLPDNRDFNYPFVALEYVQKAYRKLTNLNLINHIEDFNLGWHLTANIGTDFSNQADSPTLLWKSTLSKGFDVSERGFLFFDANFEGELYDNSAQKDRLLFNFNSAYFYKFAQRWGAYFKNANQFSQNQYLDAPIVLGGETGVRGFPLQYQHGKSSSQFTVEARYYPQINIYKLLELGGAAFIDTGRVFGQSELSKNQTTWMTSVGVGARLYSTHSSEARVIHIDIIKPLSSDENVNSIEFRVTTKHSF
tara:strand:- start:691 stop:2292 length:1602 start_codon:yes stop_codon:yes gene_type:complete